MAHHKLTVIGRLVGDPKFQPFDNGGGVAKFGIPIDFTRRKKNQATGQWEGESFIIDVDAFNKDNYKLADLVMQALKKGSLVYIEGRLRPNEYTDRNGVKVFRPKLVADVIEFLERRTEDGGAPTEDRTMRAAGPAPAARGNGGSHYDNDEPVPARGGSGSKAGPVEDDIPF
jgi:single-strand DNA-binding protein